MDLPAVAAPAPARQPPEPVARAVPPVVEPRAVTPPPAPAVAAPPEASALAALAPTSGTTRDMGEPASSGNAEAEAFRTQGDQSLRQGDVATARLFYQRAADAGDAQAALQLGHTYNPEFLEQIGVRGLRGDVALAALWYRRARDLGDADADIVLRRLPPQ
jgi:TPR repeat protein